MKLTEGDVYWFVFEYEVANRPTAGRLVRGLVSRQFLHRAADWLRSLDVIQLADILVCAYWCLLVRERSVLADPYCHLAWNSVCLFVGLSATLRSNISETKRPSGSPRSQLLCCLWLA